jgi:hypothetical protein
MSIKKSKWFKEHSINLPTEGTKASERWIEQTETNLKKKEVRNELKRLGIDTHKKAPITIIKGIPHKIVDGKLKPLKKRE